jgi:hypothetical protein
MLAQKDRTEVRIPAETTPALVVVVDTEEEFDWNADFDSRATTVEAMRHIGRAQEVFQQAGVCPTYVVDYPVAAQRTGYELLKGYVDAGNAVVGAHLHPWVNPPRSEPVSRANSFAGNLSCELEAAKLTNLSDKLEESFGYRPQIYKAGRYGLGPNTAETLESQGFLVDLSACPAFDFRSEKGPDFTGFSCRPFWFGRQGDLLGIPTTNGFVGLARGLGSPLQALASQPSFEKLHIPGILSRLGLFARLRLSPEGFSLPEMRQLTEALLRDGVRTFTLSFHSPSVEPGFTPYVRDSIQLDTFLGILRDYLDYFLGTVGGRSVTPLEYREELLTLEGRTEP